MEKKSLLLKILNLLRDESSADSPLTYEDVIEMLGTSQPINRKTVANNFAILKENGYDIKRTTAKYEQKYSYTKSKTGWYLANPDYTKEEVFILLDGIMETQNINDKNIQRLCRKILKNLSRPDKQQFLYMDEKGKRLKQTLDMNPSDVKLFEPRKHTYKKEEWE